MLLRAQIAFRLNTFNTKDRDLWNCVVTINRWYEQFITGDRERSLRKTVLGKLYYDVTFL